MTQRTTFHIPEDLKKKIDARPDVNWPQVFREGLVKKLEKLEELRSRGEI